MGSHTRGVRRFGSARTSRHCKSELNDAKCTWAPVGFQPAKFHRVCAKFLQFRGDADRRCARATWQACGDRLAAMRGGQAARSRRSPPEAALLVAGTASRFEYELQGLHFAGLVI